MATKKKSEANQNVVTETKEEIKEVQETKEELKETQETKKETKEETKNELKEEVETKTPSDDSIEIKSTYKAKIAENGQEVIGTITALNRLEIYKGNFLCPEWDAFVTTGAVLEVTTIVNNFIILGDGRFVKREDEGIRYKFNA